MKYALFFLCAFAFFACKQNTDSAVNSKSNNTTTSSTQTPPPQKETSATQPPAKPPIEAVSENQLKVNAFKAALVQMSKIGYQLKQFKELPPEKSNFNAAVRFANRLDKYDAEPVDMSGVRLIRTAFIKGIHPTKKGGNLYPRADIEMWECKDEATAKEKIVAIEALKKAIPWDVVSKSPITYWRDGHRVFFITPGGFYMLDEVPRIKGFLEERL